MVTIGKSHTISSVKDLQKCINIMEKMETANFEEITIHGSVYISYWETDPNKVGYLQRKLDYNDERKRATKNISNEREEVSKL